MYRDHYEAGTKTERGPGNYKQVLQQLIAISQSPTMPGLSRNWRLTGKQKLRCTVLYYEVTLGCVASCRVLLDYKQLRFKCTMRK